MTTGPDETRRNSASPAAGSRPLVERHRGHRRPEGVVAEGERLRPGLDRRAEAPDPLGPHGRRGLHGHDPWPGGFVGPRPRPHVEHRGRGAQGGVDPGGDPGVGAPVGRVPGAERLVVEVAGGPTGHGEPDGPGPPGEPGRGPGAAAGDGEATSTGHDEVALARLVDPRGLLGRRR